MKLAILGGLLLSATLSATAQTKTELDVRIQNLTYKFEGLQRQADKRIPAEDLQRAKGIILLDRTKAGFIFAYQGGSGVAMVREPDRSWSPAAFVKANEASLGLQVGGEKNFFVILLMTTNATHELTNSKIQFSGEATGTAGNTQSGIATNFSAQGNPVLVYGEQSGLFGGISIKGNMLSADQSANSLYYGKYVTMQDILFDNKVGQSPAAAHLAETINQAARTNSP